MTTNKDNYSAEVRKIDYIEFTLWKNRDVKAYSAVRDDPFGINLAESYENYEPKKGGLVDLRLGTCDIYLPCSTCGLNQNDCPGHFGHIDLAEPVFHFGFLNHLKVLLHCICIRCSKVLIEKVDEFIKKNINKTPEQRLKEIKLLTKNVMFCFNCGTPVSKIKREVKDTGTIKIIVERVVENQNTNTDTGEVLTLNKKIKESLSPRDCYNILRNISDTECYILGFNPQMARPEDLIINTFPVPPVIIRPTAKIDFLASATAEDALTLKIADIIRTNKTVRQQMEKGLVTNETNKYNQDFYALLQYHVAVYFDNDSVTLPRTEFKTGGRILKSVSERIKGKAGRIRSNLMGKRVDFSARSVITSDPYIDIDQVGIPKKIAMDLTIPEEVTPYNKAYLTGLVKNGRDIYPGANFIIRTSYRDGKAEVQKIDLKYRKKTIKLNLGDIVERHCIDNDYVLFNRQPTLHKPSMMGHRLQIIDNDNINTFRVNVSVCKPYNADFDGDEMNIFLAQSIQARNELKRIANVQLQIIGCKDSNPIIGCQQDALSGAYMLTESKMKLKGWEVANILCNTTAENKFDIDMNKEYSGHELFSFIIPKGINILKKSGDKVILHVVDGQLKVGNLDKSSLSNAKNSIIHFIWDKYGPSKTRRFIDDTQRLIINFLLIKGLTASFGDNIVDPKLEDQIKTIVNNNILELKYNITQMENEVDQMPREINEKLLRDEISTVQSNVSQILLKSSIMSHDNFLSVCVSAKSRGDSSNLTQVTSIIGQVSIDGVRINKKIENRSLIYFHRDDDTPEARGFINSSYFKGLKGFQLFYNSMASRDGLIDTAIKTAQTGYIQRQLIKGLEDLSIKYDGTNRNAKGVIIQQVYGENGIDQSKQTEIALSIIRMNNSTLESKLCLSKKQIDTIEKKLKLKNLDKFNKMYIDKMIDFRDRLRTIQQKALLEYKVLEDKYMLPVNIFRITQDYSNNKEHIELDPQYIVECIDKFLDDYDYRIMIIMNKNDKYMKHDNRNIKFLFEIGLYEYLAPVRCIFEYGLTKTQFDSVLSEIRLNYLKALVEPGEMVGIIAAQSIGEPTSQMTLNTKHSAGNAAKSSANMGVSRIQELLHYSKNIKTPEMYIYFNEPYANDRSMLNKIISNFKYLSIKELVTSAEVYYVINNNIGLTKKLKMDNVVNPFFINNQKTDINTLPFVIRLKMNIEKMMDKETSLLDIKTKFISYWYKNVNNVKNIKRSDKDIFNKISRCAILSNQSTDKEYIVHIRFSMTSFNYNLLLDFLNIVMNDITLKGFDNINDIYVSDELRMDFDSKTGDIKESKEYVVTTNGINFNKIRTIKGIDMKRVRCNDVMKTYKLYGIEAARQLLLAEYRITYSNAGSQINQNHLSVLVDQMCHLGDIISIDRHGMNKIDSEPIAKASFEKTMDHFINAAIFNEKDTMKSVSSRIAVGRVIQGGTGSFDLLLDINKLENSEYTENETGGRITFIPLEEEPLIQDLMKYGVTKTKFFVPK
jgi:DNA-directed RNA polymerase II subunit RPB1